MEIRSTFAVASSPASVFDALVDLERVGPCIPGATIGAAAEDGSHPARIAVKLGPMRMTYAGRVRIVSQDPATRRAVLEADVKEARGQGTAQATMTMDVSSGADAGATSVASVTDVRISGRAAQMGAGIIEDVAGRLVEQMASNLSAQLASEPAATDDAPTPEPARGSSATSASERTADPAAVVAADRQPRPAQAEAPTAAEARPLNGFGLLLKVLAERVRRLFKKESR